MFISNPESMSTYGYDTEINYYIYVLKNSVYHSVHNFTYLINYKFRDFYKLS